MERIPKITPNSRKSSKMKMRIETRVSFVVEAAGIKVPMGRGSSAEQWRVREYLIGDDEVPHEEFVRWAVESGFFDDEDEAEEALVSGIAHCTMGAARIRAKSNPPQIIKRRTKKSSS